MGSLQDADGPRLVTHVIDKFKKDQVSVSKRGLFITFCDDKKFLLTPKVIKKLYKLAQKGKILK